jgi:hypothetical protein
MPRGDARGIQPPGECRKILAAHDAYIRLRQQGRDARRR